jgi:hypothetical protein
MWMPVKRGASRIRTSPRFPCSRRVVLPEEARDVDAYEARRIEDQNIAALPVFSTTRGARRVGLFGERSEARGGPPAAWRAKRAQAAGLTLLSSTTSAVAASTNLTAKL